MYVAKDLHGTKVYQQLRNAVNTLVKDGRKRPNALGRLVKMVLNNINTNNKGTAARVFRFYKMVEIDIVRLMIWKDTNEGHEYWARIHHAVFRHDFELFPKPRVPKAAVLDMELADQLVQPAQAIAPMPPDFMQMDMAIPQAPKGHLVRAKKPEPEEQPQKKRMKWWGAV